MLQRESFWDKSLRFGRWLWKMRDSDELTYMFTLEYLLFIHCMCAGCVSASSTLFLRKHIMNVAKGNVALCLQLLACHLVKSPCLPVVNPAETPAGLCNNPSTGPEHLSRYRYLGWTSTWTNKARTLFRGTSLLSELGLVLFSHLILASRPVGPSQFALHTPVWSGRAARFLLTQGGLWWKWRPDLATERFFFFKWTSVSVLATSNDQKANCNHCFPHVLLSWSLVCLTPTLVGDQNLQDSCCWLLR